MLLHTQRFSKPSQESLMFLAAVAATATVTATVGYCGTTTNTHGSIDNKHGFIDGLIHYKKAMAVGTNCESNCETKTGDETSSSTHHREAKLKRKKTALQVATNLRKMNTKEEISKLRVMKDEMFRRWEQDEEGWRELPSRAWPEYQPNAQELEGIVSEIQSLGCNVEAVNKKNNAGDDKKEDIETEDVAFCNKLLFDMATGLVFYNIDPGAGFAMYEKLAKQGHAPSMVACGIVLIDGLGVPTQEKEGFAWLEKAMEFADDADTNSDGSLSMCSAQAMYELGTVYYTGIDGVVEEDPEKAFALFERAAKLDHTAALYMVADCLVEGEGTERSVAKAVPLFYKAAERGHRYSRQRIRELLARVEYPL